MMKIFRRVVVAIVVVGSTASFDARALDAETVEDVDLVSTGYFTVWVPAIHTDANQTDPNQTDHKDAEFLLAVGCEDGEDAEGCIRFTHEDLHEAGTLTVSFSNHTVGSPPEVARILCPGRRAGVRLRVTGLSAGTEVTATFSAESGRRVSHVVTLESESLEAAAGVRVGVCEKL